MIFKKYLFKIAMIIIIAILNNSKIISQNIIVNPNFEDLNLCCEYNMNCSYKAWYSIGGNLAQPKFIKNQHYFMVNVNSDSCIFNNNKMISAHFMNNYIVGSLIKPISNKKIYTLKIRMDDFPSSQNFQFYITSTKNFIFKSDRDTSEIGNLKIEKKIITAKSFEMDFTPIQDSSNYIIFWFHNPNTNSRHYELYLKSFEFIDKREKRKTELIDINQYVKIYNDRQRHDFINPCNQNNTLKR
ncbi:MAG: hypothetical protein WCO54_00230 [Bacteroidota bacterium]